MNPRAAKSLTRSAPTRPSGATPSPVSASSSSALTSSWPRTTATVSRFAGLPQRSQSWRSCIDFAHEFQGRDTRLAWDGRKKAAAEAARDGKVVMKRSNQPARESPRKWSKGGRPLATPMSAVMLPADVWGNNAALAILKPLRGWARVLGFLQIGIFGVGLTELNADSHIPWHPDARAWSPCPAPHPLAKCCASGCASWPSEWRRPCGGNRHACA